MSRYVRAFQPGGTFFLTLVTHHRQPLFDSAENLARLRMAVARVRRERPFDLLAAVVLPDHLHWIIRLPDGDADFSSRIGRIKARFTQSLKGRVGTAHHPHETQREMPLSASRQKHRESDVWQRRFWEHLLRDDDDLRQHVDYIHYNPVKHRRVACPHLHAASSFHTWANRGFYAPDWLCVCNGQTITQPTFSAIHEAADE